MADKLRVQTELEQLQAKFVGTGHADLTKYEWTSNIHRDTNAAILGHPTLTSYHALAFNEPRAMIRTKMVENSISPCGPPPLKDDD